MCAPDAREARLVRLSSPRIPALFLVLTTGLAVAASAQANSDAARSWTAPKLLLIPLRASTGVLSLI